MKQADGNMQSFIPVDVALKIVSNLEALDLCALGSCSRFCRELCGSNFLWESLARKRWPLLISLNDSSFSFFSSSDPIVKLVLMEGWKEVSARILQEKGWRELYVRVHREMADRATAVVELLEQSFPSESLEIGVYYKAIEDLHSMQFAFKDVEMFLFKPKLNVLLNLVGLHYSIICLRVPAVNVMNALLSCKISERQVCVKWWKLGRLFYGIRMRDESHYRWVSLADLATDKGEEVLGVLRRGAIHEVLRVEISISNPTYTQWSFQSPQRQY